MFRRLAAIAAVLVVCAFALVGCGSQSGASPQRVAGEYVKTLARNAGVQIVGDKVWSVRKLKDGVTLVVVRVRYRAYVLAGFGIYDGPTYDAVTTIFVRLLKSSYTVAG